MVPANADRDNTKSKVVAAQSCLSFLIKVSPEKAGLIVCKGAAKRRARTQSSAVSFLRTHLNIVTASSGRFLAQNLFGQTQGQVSQ